MKKTRIFSILSISLATFFMLGGYTKDSVSASTNDALPELVKTNHNIDVPVSLAKFNSLTEGENITGVNPDIFSVAREATGYHLANVKYTITKGKKVYIGLITKGSAFTVAPSVPAGPFKLSIFGVTSYTAGIYKQYRQYATVKWSAQKLENATNRIIGTINETSNTSYFVYTRMK